MKPALQTRLIGYTQHKSGHVLAPQDLVYEVEEAEVPPPRKHIPLGAKLCGVFIIVSWTYVLIQGGINTFS